MWKIPILANICQMGRNHQPVIQCWTFKVHTRTFFSSTITWYKFYSFSIFDFPRSSSDFSSKCSLSARQLSMAEHGSSSLGTSRSESQSSGCWVHDLLNQVSRTHWSGIIGNQNQHCKCLKLGMHPRLQEVVHSSHWSWQVFFKAVTVIWVWQLHYVGHKIARIHSTISDYVPYKLWTLQVSLHTSFCGQNLLQPSLPVVPVAPVTKFTPFVSGCRCIRSTRFHDVT